MKVVIVGDGKVGFTVANQLSKEDYDLIVIDNNHEVLMNLSENLDVATVEGNGAALNTQLKAGVQNADMLIALTNSDETNILACVLAKKLGCKRTAARVRNPEYHKQLYLMRDEIGLSMTINPERSGANEVYRMLQLPSTMKRESFAKGRVELVELPVKEGSKLDGTQLSKLYQLVRTPVLICAVKRGDEVYIPNGDFILKKDDHIFVTATNHNLVRFIKILGMTTRKVHDVMIIGGSKTAYYLAEDLLSAGLDVKIVELNKARSEELAEKLPEATIINADGTTQHTLNTEGIADMDAVVTLTNMDEENVIVSMYANSLHVPTVITKINRAEYNNILEEAGLTNIFSAKMMAVDDIVAYLRSMDQAEGSIRALRSIANGNAEALEFHVSQATPHLHIPLMELKLKKDLLLACIIRAGQVIIPRGQDTLEAGDTVIVVTTDDNRISNLIEIFEEE